ncbi:MAG: SMR family transporter [Candidatus Aenigmarchaeota archaeon]|nr:SMR family transporter [Candidatus Aenigmarchaeota archaeon]
MINAKIMFFILILLAVALEVAGDIFFKKWSIENKNILLLLGISIYFIGSIFWAFSLKYEYLSKAITLFTVLNLIVVILVGALFFKENLTLMNKLGILLGIVSIILLEL